MLAIKVSLEVIVAPVLPEVLNLLMPLEVLVSLPLKVLAALVPLDGAMAGRHATRHTSELAQWLAEVRLRWHNGW